MITFDDLVLKTCTLLEASSKIRTSSSEIKRILTEATIADVMKYEISNIAPKKLIVRRVVINGQKQLIMQDKPVTFAYDHTLQSGLNGWIAGNGKGKSTILKVIVWAITGVKPNFKPDVQLWLKEIKVEVVIESDLFTISYSVRGSEINGAIFSGDLDTLLATKELHPLEVFSGPTAMKSTIAHFFGSRLGFTPLEGAKLEKYSLDLTRTTVSWDVYGQALYISADDYVDYLFPNNTLSQHHQKTLSIYLGLELVAAISKLEVARDQARLNLTFEKKRVAVNAQGVRDTVEKLRSDLVAVEEQIQALDTGNSVLVDTAYIGTIREHIADCAQQISDLFNIESSLIVTGQNAQKEADRLQRTCQEINEAIQFKLFLSGLPIERCPHCEGTISQIRVEEEIQTKQCRVCRNELRPISSTEGHEVLLHNTKQALEEQKKTLNKIRRDIRKVSEERKIAELEHQKWNSKLHDLPRQERVGFSRELRELLERQGYLKGQLRHLQEQTEEHQSQHLNELKTIQEVLQTGLVLLQTEITRQNNELLQQLTTQITSFAKSFGVPNLESVFFDKDMKMFIRQTGRSVRFIDMDQSERLRLKIAFHLALLTLRATLGIGRHPALLIIDAPGSAEMDAQNFSEILKGFMKIKNSIGDHFQILIASTREDLLEICGQDRVDYHEGEETIF